MKRLSPPSEKTNELREEASVLRGEVQMYTANDGSNHFVLEAKPDGTFYGNNVDISKRFMTLQVEYEAAGFTRQQCGTGGTKHRLYIKTT